VFGKPPPDHGKSSYLLSIVTEKAYLARFLHLRLGGSLEKSGIDSGKF
jgi:hypothetical protein